MAGTEELEAWYKTLTGQEKAEAKKSKDSGQLSPALQDSLASAGITTTSNRQVIDYLKMRH